MLHANRAVGAGVRVRATVMIDLRTPNGWTMAEAFGGTARRTGRSGSPTGAVWAAFVVMGRVRRFAVLGETTRTAGRRRGLAVGAIDETVR